MARYRVIVRVEIDSFNHQAFVNADSREEAENLAIAEAERSVNEISLSTNYDAFQIEECDEEDEARIKTEDAEETNNA